MKHRYDVVITIKGRNPVIGETTNLAWARKRLKWEQRIGDGRIVDIVRDDGELIESTHPERLAP